MGFFFKGRIEVGVGLEGEMKRRLAGNTRRFWNGTLTRRIDVAQLRLLGDAYRMCREGAARPAPDCIR